MTDDSPITCSEHGNAFATYVCAHLAEQPAQRWHCGCPTEENRWPDAWCTSCNAEFEREGEWNARNEDAIEVKMICHECYESGIASSVDVVPESTRAAWRAMVRQCHDELVEKQERLQAEYYLSVHKRWDFDQESATLVFSNDGVPAVIAEVEFIGSVSTETHTWLWAWANFSLLARVRSRIAAVREFGGERGFPRLTAAKWEAAEIDGWEMAAVAAHVLGALGVYRVPSGNGFLFMAITSARHAEGAAHT